MRKMLTFFFEEESIWDQNSEKPVAVANRIALVSDQRL
jgi:hypothetical protein